MYDLKVVNGTIVDGSGAPGFRGDIGVVDGRLVAVGDAPDAASTVIDATDRVVAPGFIDIHTHLDAQVIWDPELGISGAHGVTSVVIGNCGFGIAPMRPDHHELMLRTLENVEGMSYETLIAGLGEDWGFETFPEYLDLLDRLPKAINVSVLVGHTPLRYFVMGAEAMERPATDEEIGRMVELMTEAMAAGAVGFSTSASASHNGYEGKPVPSRLATFDEVLALMTVMGDFGRGVAMLALGPGLAYPEMDRLARSTGRPLTFPLLTDMGGPGGHQIWLERAEKLQADGLVVVPQVSCRPVLFAFSLAEPYPVTTSAPAMVRLPVLDDLFHGVFRARTLEERIAVYTAAGFREKFREMTSADGWRSMIWDKTTVIDCPSDRGLEQRNVSELADERQCAPSDVVLDLSLRDNLGTRFVMGFLNSDINAVNELLAHPGTQIGLSDAGAHANQICDACYPTDLLGRWVRTMGRIRLEDAIAMMTSRPARLFGLADRGRLQAGCAADMVVFDPATVDTTTPRLVHDLPADGARLVADSIGIDWVVVNGRPRRMIAEPTIPPSYDGRLLRAGA